MMMNVRFLVMTALVILSASMPAYAIERIDPAVGLKVYSGMNYIKGEDEYYGLQIVIVPYSQGQKILWRSGNGRLDPPLLLDVSQEGKDMLVTLPEGDDNYGEWVLSLKGKMLRARGPRDLHFDLRELSTSEIKKVVH